VPGPQGHQVEVFPEQFETVSHETYLIIKPLGGQSIMDLDIFYVHCSLGHACGREGKVMPQRDNSLLVGAASPEEAVRLHALSAVSGAEASCTSHATLIPCRAVVFSRDIIRYSDEKLMRQIENEGDVVIHRFQKVDGVVTLTSFLPLTLNKLVLPEEVHCAWYRLPVKTYVLNHRRCFHCQSFGHMVPSCRRFVHLLWWSWPR